jgi:plastocyanin
MTAGGVSRWRRVAFVLAAVVAVFSYVGLRAAAGESATNPRVLERANNGKVGIADFEFQPTPLRVKAGSKVVFANESRVTHTATEKGSFNTGKIKPGKSVAIAFKHPGTFTYFCSIHPFMHGKIVVK